MNQSSADTGLKLGAHEVRKCPCNDPICKKWVVYPTFSTPDASLSDRAEAEEIVRRLNYFESSANPSQIQE